MTSLVASTTMGGARQPQEPAALGEPVFTIPFSGWYWQIKALDGSDRPLYVSDSLLDQQLKLPSQYAIPPDKSLTRRAYAQGPEDQRLRVVEREIRPAGPNSTPYSYAVAGDAVRDRPRSCRVHPCSSSLRSACSGSGSWLRPFSRSASG